MTPAERERRSKAIMLRAEAMLALGIAHEKRAEMYRFMGQNSTADRYETLGQTYRDMHAECAQRSAAVASGESDGEDWVPE